ncbi:MAG TPA: SDR family NAD(P)-dependent oxidoreductase [Bacillota bacterium]|nr:SDR family NAD(P)-dependent oxidoreductase [Bacillota bacterium]
MDLGLNGKVVMITGATGGVGEALVEAFAKEGCKLAISSTKQEKMDMLIAGLTIEADRLKTFIVDVTKEDQVKNMVEETVKASDKSMFRLTMLDMKEEWHRFLNSHLKTL